MADSILTRARPLLVARLAGALVTVAVPMVLARVLVPASYGTFKQAFLVSQTLALILPMGLTQSLYYFVPREPRARHHFVAVALWSHAALGALAAKYPGDRIALLSSTRDLVISAFFLLTPDRFEAALRQLATDVIAPLPKAKTFIVAGPTHTMLGAPQRYSAGGVPLVEWLRREVEDDPAWQSVGP